MNTFINNLFVVDADTLKIVTLMVASGIFLLQQTTQKTAASFMFAPIMMLCALIVRSAALPIGITLGMDEGEFLVTATTIGMCISLGLFACYSRYTSTMN